MDKIRTFRCLNLELGAYNTSCGVNFIFLIYTFQRDTRCSCTDCLSTLRCQLHMFWTATVRPQEPPPRRCMCRLWYVLIRPAGTTFEEELLKRCTSGTHQHIQHLKRSSWGHDEKVFAYGSLMIAFKTVTFEIIMKSIKFLYFLLFFNKNFTFICLCYLFLLLIYNSLCFIYKIRTLPLH